MAYKAPQVKLAIVDDHKLMRKGIISLINMADDEFKILFEAGNGQEMITKLDKKLLPDIVIMDIDMPDMDGFKTVAWLQEHYPDIGVLVVSMIEKEEAIVRMLKLGVKGYLSKDIEPKDIQAALRQISNKGYYYTDYVTGKLIHSILNNGKAEEEHGFNQAAWNKLSERERQFIQHVCSELKYIEIAEKMHLSPKTIDGYRDSLFEKFNVKSRVGLVLFAIKNGLVKI